MMKKEDTTTLLRLRKMYGEKLVDLWLYKSSVGIYTADWMITNEKIKKVKSVLQDVCYLLADNDAGIATRYYLSYVNYLDQKTNQIMDEM